MIQNEKSNLGNHQSNFQFSLTAKMASLWTLHLANTSLLERSLGTVLCLCYDESPPLVNRIHSGATLLIIDSVHTGWRVYRTVSTCWAKVAWAYGLSLIVGEAKEIEKYRILAINLELRFSSVQELEASVLLEHRRRCLWDRRITGEELAYNSNYSSSVFWSVVWYNGRRQIISPSRREHRREHTEQLPTNQPSVGWRSNEFSCLRLDRLRNDLVRMTATSSTVSSVGMCHKTVRSNWKKDARAAMDRYQTTHYS